VLLKKSSFTGRPLKQPTKRLPLTRSSISGSQKFLLFLLGFSIEFNILIGGGGDVSLGTSGYRITDFLAIATACLLGFRVLIRRANVLVLGLFGLLLAIIVSFRFFDPSFWGESHTQIIVGRYLVYGFAGLYVALLLDNTRAADLFCWGLITGLLATASIFIIQGAGLSSELAALGIKSTGIEDFVLSDVGTSRYTGLWGHPNEAGHVAALASAAGAYFVVVHRRFIPLTLVAIGLGVTFAYTQNRGGLLAGGATLGISLLFSRQRRLEIVRTLTSAFSIVVIVTALLQFSTFTSRFLDDPMIEGNYEERLDTIWAGIHVVLDYPFGVPIREFSDIMTSQTGLPTPHNGFVYFAAIFGLLPLIILLTAFANSLRVRNDADVLCAFLTIQVCLSFLFEQLHPNCSYTFVLCVILARASLRVAASGRKAAPHAKLVPRYSWVRGGDARTRGSQV